jgi:FSR family fosmidomycin resistance protein-like MFS transporter
MGQTIAAPAGARGNAGTVLGAISLCHLINDMLQSLLPAVYPILKGGFDLNFAQIGALTLTYQITASLLQPVIGAYTDRRPQPYSLPIGMALTLLGLVTLALASSYATLLAGAALLGMGSSIFHPESSRIARLASGGQHGLAQSIFQVGGNFGQALGPLLAAFIILPLGRGSIAWFSIAALIGIAILSGVGRWYQANGHARRPSRHTTVSSGLPARHVATALAVLVALIFSKFFYLASFTSYYIFYLMHRFHLGVQAAQIDLFIFMAASAVGTVAGGPVGDRIGRKRVIWGSIGGVVPFALALPYAGLSATIWLSVIIGLVLSSAFSAIVVYAQELVPGRVGTISGLFFGLAFGMGGIGAAVLGVLADHTSIEFVYRLCAFLPLIGLAAAFLPHIEDTPVVQG